MSELAPVQSIVIRIGTDEDRYRLGEKVKWVIDGTEYEFIVSRINAKEEKHPKFDVTLEYSFFKNLLKAVDAKKTKESNRRVISIGAVWR